MPIVQNQHFHCLNPHAHLCKSQKLLWYEHAMYTPFVPILLHLWNFWLAQPSSPKFLTSTLETSTLWNMLCIDSIGVLCAHFTINVNFFGLAYQLHLITHKDFENHFLKGHVEYMPLCLLGNFGSNSWQAPRKPLQKWTCQCRPLCWFHWPFENFGLHIFPIGA